MRPLDVAGSAGWGAAADVAVPQAAVLGDFSCQSGVLWAIVHAGRTQAAFASRWGSAQCTALQKYRSRGCRAPRSPFWPFAWLPSWLAAPRKKKSFTWTSRRLRPSRFTPVNTSKTEGRACGAMPRPALFLSGFRRSDRIVSANFPFEVQCGLAVRDAAGMAAPLCPRTQRSLTCGPLLSLPLSPLLRSRLAPSRPPSRSPRPSQLSRPLPANTSKPFGLIIGRGLGPASSRAVTGRAFNKGARLC